MNREKLTRATPFEKEVSRWVERAKAMEPNVCESISFIDGEERLAFMFPRSCGICVSCC